MIAHAGNLSSVEQGWRDFSPGAPVQYRRPTPEYLHFLAREPRSRKLQEKREQAIKAEIQACRMDPHYWLECWVWTIDEQDSKDPFKPWPALEYQQYLTRAFCFKTDDGLYPPLFIAKSRQMMVTWQLVLLFLHMAIFNQGRLIFFQSQKEEASNALLKRKCLVVLDRLPFFLKPKFTLKKCHLEFPDLMSEIRAVPKGPDQARGYTASGWFSDEAAFQDLFEETYSAILPMVRDGGRFVAASTAAPSEFELYWKGVQ